MTDEHRMEALSRAYAQAIAAVCGCTCARPEPDYGMDLILRQAVFQQDQWREAGAGLYVQLKSIAGATLTPTDLVYDLKATAYETLRRSTRSAPSVLILLDLPADRAEWINHTEDRLELRRCAYWLSLRGMPVRANTSSVRIRIPRTNQFTPAALERIMTAIRQRRNI